MTERNGVANREALRRLPSIAAVATHPDVVAAADGIRPEIVTAIAQEVVERSRAALLAGDGDARAATIVADVRRALLALERPRLATVINATGVIVHTNLGRSPVSAETALAMAEAATRYTPLELELESGRRGGRMAEVTGLLRALAGAEAALVVNNNAAAVLLVLSALCSGREVILSRSQAVEIGGGFRIPDVMAQSGARLVEVGTTNRTYARDYEAAITGSTAALLTVHWSNFRIIGFTAQPELRELAELARRHELALIEDLGSGTLIDTAPYGLAHEPTVAESLAAGVDLICFSGDKLLGGPQAGIVAGREDLVRRVAAHPLARAVRADKTALAGVAATLRHYLRGDVTETVPIWRMIAAGTDALAARCRAWAEALGDVGPLEVVVSQAAVGGGSLPGETLESRALAIDVATAARHGLRLDALAARLRSGSPALMPHVEEGRLLVDARTVLPDQDADVVRALAGALGRTDQRG
ncbi:MAG TPA: L-seryl-tRNA(Sec) selenium transferase [Thermomicrobiaceae bacterium]|nr:L-seryl-tRNA(Sec) selenium transferase [Thermomicrobiaceae bacterium]